MSAEQLVEHIGDVRQSLDDEIKHREYATARFSAGLLIEAAGRLGELLDAMPNSDEREALVAVHDGAAEHWIEATKIIRAYDEQLAAEPDGLDKAHAERDADTVAVAALLHWAKQDYDSGHLLVGATTSVALVNLEKRFATRIKAVNTGLAAQGRRTWDVNQ